MNSKANRKDSIIFGKKGIISTIVLFAGIALISVLLSFRIQELTKEQCYSVLTNSTEDVCTNVESNFRNDRSSLRMLSRVVALEDDLSSDAVNSLLTTYDVSSMATNIAILTPDNEIIPVRGNKVSAEGIMEYAEKSRRGEHISGLYPSLNNPDSMVLQSYVPIKKSGKVAGVLFIEMNPAAIASAWAPEIYGGAASFCIIDRETGDFLINGWDDSIRNTADLQDDALASDMCSGKTGFVQMKNASGEDIFVSFMPMQIENWEIMISANKSDVFSFTNQTRRSLYLFLIGGAALLILYLFWLMYNNRRSILAAEEKANNDVLTGLQNRNRYESFCKKIADRAEGMCCIYLDANGLHEINNTKGHLAGDRMLRFIADALKVAFGEDAVYRIGGDEFVVFQKKAEGVEQKLQEVHSEIERNDYHVSSGLCVCEKKMTVTDLIKTAEKRMYEAKAKYYESIGKQVRNQKQE